MVNVDKIKALAQEKGIKLGYLARQINVPHTYFADIKNKNRDIPDERLSVIAKELSTTVAYLRDETDVKDIENKQFDTEHPNIERHFMRSSQELAIIIKRIAKEQNITIGKMLSDCQLSVNTLSSMQSGGYYPRIEAIVKIADYLDVSVDYLLGRDSNDTQNGKSSNEESDKKSAAIELTENESNLLTAYRQLNAEGKTRAEHSIFDLASNELYQLPQFRAEIVRQIPEDYDEETSAFAYLPVAAFHGGISYVKLTKIQLARANEIHGMTPRENPMIEKYRKKNRKP